MTKIKLGDKVRSTVSGFEGTTTGIAEFIYYPKLVQVTASEPIGGEIKIAWLPMTELEIAE
ncbi:hypothetical protein [Alistipes sp.]|uniref:hypothetical protein n=1 Tax=Alistipes sp. TaxID=1872444 RepID=UPI003AB79C63